MCEKHYSTAGVLPQWWADNTPLLPRDEELVLGNVGRF
jgi:hypothetical protein